MIISAIVARADNRVIGIDNRLPWHLPGDLKWFKEKTLHRHIIMGRKSFESIPKPLPNRINIVITRDKSYYHSGAYVVHTIDEALKLAYEKNEEEVFILGGGKIYLQTMDIWDRLYLTEVHASPEGDTHFPEIDLNNYDLAYEEFRKADEKNEHDFTFKILHRRKS